MAKAGHFEDGLGIRIVLVNQALVFYEKDVTPSGLEGGDPINITTNDNTAQHTQAARTLSIPTQASATVTYDVSDEAAYFAAVDVSDDVRTDYPDDTTTLEAGWLRSFIPNQTQEGEQPTAAVVFEFQGEAPV